MVFAAGSCPPHMIDIERARERRRAQEERERNAADWERRAPERKKQFEYEERTRKKREEFQKNQWEHECNLARKERERTESCNVRGRYLNFINSFLHYDTFQRCIIEFIKFVDNRINEEEIQHNKKNFEKSYTLFGLVIIQMGEEFTPRDRDVALIDELWLIKDIGPHLFGLKTIDDISAEKNVESWKRRYIYNGTIPMTASEMAAMGLLESGFDLTKWFKAKFLASAPKPSRPPGKWRS